MVTVPVRRVIWPRSVRIIRSIYPPIDLFEDIADPADWEALASAEAKFNPRIRDSIGDLSKVPLARRVTGPGASWVMSPFVHCSPLRPGRFAGILFEEYNGSVTLSNGTSERLIPTGEGIAFPMGTFDTFTTYGGPANLLDTANTIGLPLYARQMIDAKGRWIDLMTEASILPVNKRPRLAIRLFSSN